MQRFGAAARKLLTSWRRRNASRVGGRGADKWHWRKCAHPLLHGRRSFGSIALISARRSAALHFIGYQPQPENRKWRHRGVSRASPNVRACRNIIETIKVSSAARHRREHAGVAGIAAWHRHGDAMGVNSGGAKSRVISLGAIDQHRALPKSPAPKSKPAE